MAKTTLLETVAAMPPPQAEPIRARRAILRRSYIKSHAEIVGVNFWSEADDVALDAIDELLNRLVVRQAAGNLEGSMFSEGEEEKTA